LAENNQPTNLYIGVMSGTSLDGIDIALCSISTQGIETLHSKEYSYDSNIKQDVLNAISNSITLEFLGILNHKLGTMYANAINQFLDEFNIDSKSVKAIGLHGQTIWHSPNTPYPFSMQIGDSSLVAKKTGIDVVNDFRSADIANGGQGAPIAPAFHKAIFNDSQSAVLNLGGISNITILSDEFSGFDAGVANILSDYWIGKHKNKTYDKDGEWAREGKVSDELLRAMLSDPYFKKKPPKSTGREYFNATWLEEKLELFDNISAVDIQATLLEFTIQPIVKALEGKKVKRLIVCGGGAHNGYLMKKLSQKLDGIKVMKSDDLGVKSTFLEAIAFAWLAYKRVNNEAIDLQNITGSSKPSILGVIHAKD
jgi:anhydro-N-acetylmuramic acid kinase